MALHIVKDITKITLTAVPFLIMAVACNRATTQPPIYGERVQYAEGQPLNFPDVTLEFVGKRKAPGSADYPRGMTFYDFRAHQGSQAQLVSWTAGTGDIGPTLFEVAGSRYALELAMSDKLGSLDEDELVLWREAIPATEAPMAIPIPTPASPPLEAQDYYDWGFVQFAAGLTEEAVASFTQAITLHPTYIEAYQLRGNAYCQLGRYDLARADYEQVLALEPQPNIQATVTAALQEIAQAESIAPTRTPALPTPASLTPPVKITLGQPFSLALDQYGRLDSAGLGVRFYEIVEDTRCPRQVECEIPGWARIAIYAWVTDIEPIEIILNTDPATDRNVVLYGEYQIRLLRLDPYPETPEADIAPQDYRATFVVSK
jgi:tetratricopeptide (TPR) repeat protein